VTALDDEVHQKFNRMLSLFQGDLLPGLEQGTGCLPKRVPAQQYLKMVYRIWTFSRRPRTSSG
jgi:hypothetical protein